MVTRGTAALAIAGLCAPLACVAGPPQWLSISVSDDSALFIDTANIRRRGATVEAWLLTNFNAPKDGLLGSYQSNISLWSLDCANERITVKANIWYREKSGRGQTVFSADTGSSAGDPTHIVPGSIGDVVSHYLCRGN